MKNLHVRIERGSSSSTVNGFTLIEMILVLFMFGLVMAMGYKAVASTAMGRNIIIEKVDRQSTLRSSYRALSNAFSSQAQMKGQSKRVDIDLTTANNHWLVGSKRIVFSISDQGKLLAYLDDERQASVLLGDLEQASFRYYVDGVSHSEWNETVLPSWVGLTWLEGDHMTHWRFAVEK